MTIRDHLIELGGLLAAANKDVSADEAERLSARAAELALGLERAGILIDPERLDQVIAEA